MSAVRRSFERAKRAGFAQHFYDLLLAPNQAIREKFSRTDFDRQRSLLIHGVYSMLDYAEGKTMGRMAIERLARSHGPKELAVNNAMMTTWLDCFIEAMRVCDPEFNAELDVAWREALGPALTRFRAEYSGAVAASGGSGSSGARKSR